MEDNFMPFLIRCYSQHLYNNTIQNAIKSVIINQKTTIQESFLEKYILHL